MKKLVIILILFASGILFSTAQPNGGFENWTTEASYEIPDGWATLNFLSLLSPPNPVSVFKAIGIDKHSGNYAMKVVTIGVTNNPNPGLIGDTAGGVFTGRITLSPFSYGYGFPYTGRPEKLEFWAKSNPVGSDSASALVALFNNNGTIRDTVALGKMVIPPTSEYQLFHMDLTYYSTGIPDTASIAFGASKYKSHAEIGSTLFIDDVAFTGWVGVEEKNIYTNKVKVFPNPAHGNLTITTEIEEAQNLKISDVSGKMVGRFKIQNYITSINTSLYTEGLYFYEIVDKKEKVLTKGKFGVVK
ncbi:MAG: T9SS type A sorting domain-containing protein [Bacteroidota bacterium]